MVLVVLVAILLFSGALLLLVGRVVVFGGNRERLQSSLLLVDAVAFDNLLCGDDDAFLRSALSGRPYRKAKRVRTRAVQKYLRSIAHNCAVLQLLLRFVPHEVRRADAQVRSLGIMSLRLRIATLSFWAALWGQWLFPSLDFKPNSLVRAYEDFFAQVKACLGPMSWSVRLYVEHP